MINDATLLRRYAAERAEEAFAEFVRRNLPLVYSAAARRLGGDAHRAEDVAQTVFCAAARDAHRLSRHPKLAGWLYTATRYAVSDVIRAEKRRRVREEEAHIMHETSLGLESAADWSRLRPVLDAAMDKLNDHDREAVLLRFFQGRPFAEIGHALGLSEDAARKRVERALDKLRGLLRRHQIASTSAALAALLAGETVIAAPAGLGASITGAAIASGGAATAGIATAFTVTKLQAGIAAAMIIAGAAGLVTQQRTISELRANHADTRQELARLATENTRLAQASVAADTELARLRTAIAGQNAPADASRRTGGAAAATLAAGGLPASRDISPAAAAGTAPVTAQKRQQWDYMHHRYDPFLQKYGLTPAQMDRFIELKIAIAEAQEDLQSATRQAGAQGGSPGVEAMRWKLVGPMWDEIHQMLGEEGSRAYPEYETLSGFRVGLVEPMLPAFVSVSAPLSPSQVDRLVETLASNKHSVRANPTDNATTGIIHWDAVFAKAGGFLTPAQLTVLQDYAYRNGFVKR